MNIPNRVDNLQARIRAGRLDGSLTRQEAAPIRQELRDTRIDIIQRRDAGLTRDERRNSHYDLNDLSNQIFQGRH
ncbi:MAG: hypothetical protein VKP72_09535 [bacterium]|nr:hypothetical protein [bacterium]